MASATVTTDHDEESELAFLHQDTTDEGRQSRFDELVARDTAKRRGRGGTPHRSTTARSTTKRKRRRES